MLGAWSSDTGVCMSHFVGDIQGLVWDWSSGRLFFSSASQGTVFALPLDTSEPTPQVLVSGRVSPRGVTLNVVTR